MSSLLRYWRLWCTLAADERRVRAQRVIDRWLRRNRWLRRLGLAPEARWRGFVRALRVSPADLARRLSKPDPRRGPLGADLASRVAAIAACAPGHLGWVLEQAEAVLAGRIDILGLGSTSARDPLGIDWHRDPLSGHGWDPDAYHVDLPLIVGGGADVRLLWELSRGHHFVLLGQAWALAPLGLAESAASDFRGRVANTVRASLDDWMVANPPGVGVNWASPMEVAIRAVNWLAALALLRGAPELDAPFLLRVARALWLHGRHIRRNLEIGPAGLKTNHYLANVAGLYAIGAALPELVESESWRALGRSALCTEMEEQVLSDGADFERSTAYHRLAAEIFLHAELVARALDEPLPPAFLERLAAMLELTAALVRPDGSVAAIGDDDGGRWLPLEGAVEARRSHRHLLALGGRLLGRADLVAAAGDDQGARAAALWLLGPLPELCADPAVPGSRAFAASGFYVERADDLHLTVACGPVGTRGLGNHSHNDLFAPSVWALGREWIADPGTGTYGPDLALRNRLRATAAHATLAKGAREQNPIPGGIDGLFRLEERARPEVTSWQASADGAVLCARHRGFASADQEWIHERTIEFDARARLWRLRDRLFLEPMALIVPAPRESVFLRFPIAPGVTARLESETSAWPGALAAALVASVAAAGDARDGIERRHEAVELRAGSLRFWLALDLPATSVLTIGSAEISPAYGRVDSAALVCAEMPLTGGVRCLTLLFAPPREPGA